MTIARGIFCYLPPKETLAIAQNGTPAPLVILNRHLGQADSDIAIHILQGGLSYVYDIYIYISFRNDNQSS